MNAFHYLVFGDLHGRILPAFRLATVWSREHDIVIDGLLQVGDLGFFPYPELMDKATKAHAKKDPLEAGASLIIEPNKLADQVFAEPEVAETLWHTIGNHEDYQTLDTIAQGCSGNDTDFPIDAYVKVRCIRDGKVSTLPSGLRVGALWGIDKKGPNARRNKPERAYINDRSASELAADSMDVLLTHDSARDAKYPDSGSEEINIIHYFAQPAFSFFGHYHGVGREMEGDFGNTRVFHMGGFELRGKDGCAEEGSVGVFQWDGKEGSFEYLDPKWLKTFTRHNWKYR